MRFPVPVGAGQVVASAGDFDGDAIDDFIVRGFTMAGNRNATVVSGKGGSVLGQFASDLSGQDGFGLAVAVVGDIDGRGTPDVLVGAPTGRDSLGMPWHTYATVFAGEDGAVLFYSGDMPWNSSFGSAVCGVGDLNGDDVPDFAIGRTEVNGGASAPGSVSVYSGVDGSLIRVLLGTQSGDGFGATIASLADVDGDGVPDLAVGSLGAATGDSVVAAGVTVFSGGTGAVLRSMTDNYKGQKLEGRVVALARKGALARYMAAPCAWAGGKRHGVSIVDAGTGRRIRTLDAGDREAFGSAMAGLGDVDGDGFPDLAIRSIYSGIPGVGDDAAFVEVFSGAGGSLLFSFRGTALDGAYATAIASAGDVDGDGKDEVLVGFSSMADVAIFGVGPGVVPPTLRLALQRPAGGPDVDARGQLEVGTHSPAQPMVLTTELLDYPGDWPNVYLEESPGTGTYLEVGFLRPGYEAGSWTLDVETNGWTPPESFRYRTLEDMAGSRVEVRGPSDEVLLFAVIPAASGQKFSGRSLLAPPSMGTYPKARGTLQVSSSAKTGTARLKLTTRGLPSGGSFETWVEDSPGVGTFTKCGDLMGRQFLRDSGKGDLLPGGAPDGVSLSGRHIEVREGGEVVLEGTFP